MSWGIEAFRHIYNFKHDVTPGFSETRRYCVNFLFSTLKRGAVALWGQIIGYRYIYNRGQFHKDRTIHPGVSGIITTATIQNISKDNLKQKAYPFLTIFFHFIPLNTRKANGNIGQRWINPFHANVLFLYPLKTKGFLTFSWGIEKRHWHEKG